jgi:hypothetical protein
MEEQNQDQGKELARIPKNETTAIVIREAEWKGSKRIDIREYVTTKTYTGWSKSGLSVPLEKFQEFKDAISKIEIKE